MEKKVNNKGKQKLVKAIVGFFILVVGIAMILAFWKDVVVLFRAGMGIVLALAGLVVLYTLKD